MKSISKICLALILVCAITFPAIAQEKKPVKPLKPEKTPVPVRVPAPDLVVKEIKCGPGNKLQFTVANIGTAPLPSGWIGKSHVWINERSLFDSIDLKRTVSVTRGGIENPGGTSTYVTPYEIVAPVAVKVETDFGNYIRESNERNNAMIAKVAPCGKPNGKPDLTIKFIITGPTSNVRPGFMYSPAMIQVEVRNIGTASALGTRSAGASGYLVSYSITPSVPVSPRSPVTDTLDITHGASQRYSWGDFGIPSDAVRGSTYELCAHVDPTNVVDELREDNNKTCTRISVSP
jgi:hypothetical protein